MRLIERAKNLLLQPTREWEAIAGEPTATTELFLQYAIPLAAIGPIAALIGQSLIGISLPFLGTYRTPVLDGLAFAVLSFVFALLGVVVVALIINALAPTFSGEKNLTQAMKCAVYAYTPAWLAGIFNLLPTLSVLVLLAALYGLYLLYLGLPVSMKSPKEKAPGYTGVVVICAIVLSLGLGALAWQMTLSVPGSRTLGGLAPVFSGSGQEVKLAPDSALGKLEAFTKKLEESAKKMEEADKKGDVEGAIGGAMEGFATLASGGKKAQPLAIEELKTFLPETWDGMQRADIVSEQNSFVSMSVTTTGATYRDAAGRHVKLSIGDLSAAGGLFMLSSMLAMGTSTETEDGYEKLGKLDGRTFLEKMDKRTNTAEFGLVIGERFLVNTRAQDLDVNALRALVGRLDLARLEALKDKGVQQ